jgi:hypothetical protein
VGVTEDRWLTSTDSRLLFQWLARPGGDRKTLLWFAACGRAIWPLLPCEHSRQAIEWLERDVEGVVKSVTSSLAWLAEADQFRFDFFGEHRDQFPEYEAETAEWIQQVGQMPLAELHSLAGWDAETDSTDPLSLLSEAAGFAVSCLSDNIRDQKPLFWVLARGDFVRFLNPHLLRCIFGNPFRPVAFDPAWRTESAVALARTAYDTRNFTLLPILADALEEAGCDHADLLTHCRDPQATHARGCWVVDLVLNKS